MPARSFGRRRAACLILVHVLIAAHIIHWRLAGRTLAPLELNEVMYTLEIGIITAGFVFMTIVCIGTVCFGRFFCSWGCHILALQDLSAWVLAKLRIRPKPIRSRCLLFVPPLAMLYMFVWPQITRLLDGRPMPVLHLRTDGEGWASFVTNDFWRNLPGPGIAALTFLVCGFAIVYVLGSRSFCTYVCPYGAIFGLADRFAPGRIVARGDCTRCGICTAICQSRVHVHEEVSQFGKVVDPACLKDLDCVAACPDGALAYGLARPPLLELPGSRKLKPARYDFSLPEELILGLVFLVTFFIYRGLYGSVPFLMSLALAAVLGYCAVLAARLAHRSHVRLANMQLKIGGGLRRAGQVFVIFGFAVLILTMHSAVIRYHEVRGTRAHAAAAAAKRADDKASMKLHAAQALAHLQVCEKWGLFRTGDLLRRIGSLQMDLEQPAEAQRYLSLALSRGQTDASTLRDHGRACFALGEAAAELGDLQASLLHFRKAVGSSPQIPEFHYNLGVILSALGWEQEAVAEYQQTLRLAPDDVDALNNLGLALAQRGNLEDALRHLRRAVAIKPDAAHPHFNLGRILASMGDVVEAESHFNRAAELDARYAAMLRSAGGESSDNSGR